jgi:hypothetical protein
MEGRLVTVVVIGLLATGCGIATRNDDDGDDDDHATDADAPGELVDVPIDEPGLPHIHNMSGAPSERIVTLVRAAINGLGFDPATGEGPNERDRFFAGRHYLAWIDQTGFYGKMNGLWALDGAVGDALDFVVKDPDGRPVNAFIPGEDGEGRWAPGYRGAEHIEFPSNVREPNDPAGCTSSGSVCNWYSANEAAPITNAKIPWWSACNPGSANFSDTFDAIVVQAIPGGLKLVYESPLVKQADGDGTNDGDACHADELFPDGVRRRVYVRLGYELWADAAHIDRTMQIRNPAGNPSFTGPMSLIGGFVMTSWPNPYYLKRFHRFWRPETSNVDLTWGTSQLVLSAGAWNDVSHKPQLPTDVLVGWIDQPITLSAIDDYASGKTMTLSHIGPSDNRDVGVCLCSVHGGLEMGGGLIHGGMSLPIDGGEMTIEAKRRLALSDGVHVPPVEHAYQAETQVAHGVGRPDADGWSANTATDSKGYLSYGPYATDWGEGAAQAVFYLMVDNNSADNQVVATIDINDATTDESLVSRQITRRQFRTPSLYQRFAINVDLTGRAGHKMEARVWWTDTSYVRVDRIVVNTSPF